MNIVEILTAKAMGLGIAGYAALHRAHHGEQRLPELYRIGKLLLNPSSPSPSEPLTFFEEKDGKLFLYGAHKIKVVGNAVYIDCEPEWAYPEASGDTLTITQVNSATMYGDTLEVR